MINIRETIEYKEFGYQIIECPICGYETLDNNFICPHCGWEYDGMEEDNQYSRVNHSTVWEYRANKGVF